MKSWFSFLFPFCSFFCIDCRVRIYLVVRVHGGVFIFRRRGAVISDLLKFQVVTGAVRHEEQTCKKGDKLGRGKNYFNIVESVVSVTY